MSNNPEQFRTGCDDFDRDLVSMMGFILETDAVQAREGHRAAVDFLTNRLGSLIELRDYTAEELEALHHVAWNELDQVHREIAAMTGAPQHDQYMQESYKDNE